MSTEGNKAIVHRIFDEFLNTGDPDAAEESFAADFVNHSPGRGTAPDREGMKQFITTLACPSRGDWGGCSPRYS